MRQRQPWWRLVWWWLGQFMTVHTLWNWGVAAAGAGIVGVLLRAPVMQWLWIALFITAVLTLIGCIAAYDLYRRPQICCDVYATMVGPFHTAQGTLNAVTLILRVWNRNHDRPTSLQEWRVTAIVGTVEYQLRTWLGPALDYVEQSASKAQTPFHPGNSLVHETLKPVTVTVLTGYVIATTTQLLPADLESASTTYVVSFVDADRRLWKFESLKETVEVAQAMAPFPGLTT